MKKLFSFLENKLAPLGEKIGSQRHLKALREGVLIAMPLVLLGSFFVLIKDFPVDAWVTFLKDNGIYPILDAVANNSFGLMALITAFGIAYRPMTLMACLPVFFHWQPSFWLLLPS